MGTAKTSWLSYFVPSTSNPGRSSTYRNKGPRSNVLTSDRDVRPLGNQHFATGLLGPTFLSGNEFSELGKLASGLGLLRLGAFLSRGLRPRSTCAPRCTWFFVLLVWLSLWFATARLNTTRCFPISHLSRSLILPFSRGSQNLLRCSRSGFPSRTMIEMASFPLQPRLSFQNLP